jgi:PAS domain S-box-containing protein
MIAFLSKLFDTSDFPARWHCGNWTAGHGWLHIVSDLAVWSAYFAIPCILMYFVLRRRDIPFRSVFLLFGAFILACGTTHLMEAIIFWWPAYRLAGVIKLFTALVSWGTVLALVQVTPKVLAMRSAEELEREIDARKKAEQDLQKANSELQQRLEALRQSEERFRLLVDGTTDYAIFKLDPSGHVVSWNTGGERIKGYRADEIIGQHFSRFYSSEDVQAGKPERELQVAATEGRYEDEGWRLRKDGSRFWSNVVITALRDQSGSLRGFSKITRDITERKQAEENARRLLEEAAARRAAEEHAAAIWEERERLRVTLQSIGDGVIATDAEERVTLLNPVAEALTGWESVEATGKPLSSVLIIINEQTRQPVENPVSKALREGRIVGLANHTVLAAKDGTERPIDDSAAPIRDQNGRTIGAVMVFRDVTERRRVDKALRQSAAHLRIVTESMAAPVTHCGRDLKYKWASKPYADWINRSPEEIVDRPIIDIIGKEAFERLRPRFEQVLSGQTVRYEEAVEFEGIGRRWINSVYTPTLDTAGVPDGWVAVVIDVTEQKRNEEALKDADRRKDEFLATLAHELRNPLAPVRNAVELLRQAGDDPTVMEETNRIMERQISHMVRLIDDLMDISRVTSGKLQLRKEQVELAAAVQSALEEVRPLIEASGHEFTVRLPEEPVVLNADPTRLAQVFSNLLNNAAKYTENGGHIWLTAERRDGEVVVSVRDTGIGIDAAHLPRIFEMFSQAASALERSEGGLGIGLALVRGLVELHDGRIEACSNGPGMGSEFVVRLPVLESRIEASAERPADGQVKNQSGLKRRILVVDDNADSATSLALLLRRMGHEIETAYDGLEAVQAAAAFRPQVILLDIGLPKMNGYEAAKRIREQPWQEKVAIIALTGWAQEKDKQRAYDAGIDHHLTKPVEYATLEKLLALIAPS